MKNIRSVPRKKLSFPETGSFFDAPTERSANGQSAPYGEQRRDFIRRRGFTAAAVGCGFRSPLLAIRGDALYRIDKIGWR
jgi:hypothetical protein